MAIVKEIDIIVDTGDAVKELGDLNKSIEKVDKNTTNLNKTFEDVYGDIKPLTGRLGELEDRLYELANAGDTTSKEFITLSNEVGRLRKVQIDTDKTTDALAQTTSQKLGGSMQFAAGAMQTAVGGMAALGIESEKGEKAIEGIVGAMAVTDGLETMNESSKSVRALGKAIKSTTAFQKAATIAQRIFNAAMAANPIGVIVLAITSLIAAGYALIKMFQASSEATANVNAELDKQEEALKNVEKAQDKANKKMTDAQNHQIALMKAQGKTTEEIRKQERANAANTIAMAEAEVASNKLLKAEQERALWLAKDNGDEEQIERAEANLKKSQDILKKSIEDKNKAHEERIELTKRYEIEDAQIITNSEKQKAQSRKASGDKAAADKKKAEEEKAAALEAIRIAEIDTEEERRKEELRKVEEQYKKLIAAAEKYNQDTDELKAAQQTKEKELREKFAAEDKARQDKIDQEKKDKLLKEQEDKIAKLELDKENDNLAFEAQRELINQREALLLEDETLTEQQRTELEKQFKEARVKIADLEFQEKQRALNGYANALGDISGVIGQETAAGKSIAVASSLISTYSSIAGQLQAFSKVPVPGYAIAQAIATGAVGLANVKKIISTKVPNTSGGSSSVGSLPTATSQAPSFNIVGATETSQLADAIGEQTQQPVQAYVVANDVTTAQSLNNNIVEGASIG